MSKERGEATEVSPAILRFSCQVETRIAKAEGPPFNSHNREVVVKD